MANPKGNPQNFIKNSELDPETLREKCSRAGKRSGEVKRQKKNMRQRMLELFNDKIDENDVIYEYLKTKFKKNPEIIKNMDYGQALVLSIYTQGFTGNKPFVDETLEISGDKTPSDTTINVNNTDSVINQLSMEELKEIAFGDNDGGTTPTNETSNQEKS